MAIPSTTPRQVTSHGSSPPLCIAQLAKRDRALSALFAWTVVREPPCPVLRACNRSAAAHLADDDVIGAVPQGVAHEVADRDRCSSSGPRAGWGAFPQGYIQTGAPLPEGGSLSSLPSRLEPQPRGAVTRRAVAQRRSRASGLTRPSAAAIRVFDSGFGLGFVAVPFSPVLLRFEVSLLFSVFYL